MKLIKKTLSWILTVAMLSSFLPVSIFASGNEYSITNGYLTYTFNPETGGFAIETAEGNPQKKLDNDIPLLYEEDEAFSNGTSFISVRVNDEDFIFGQDYKEFFGKRSELKTPVISEEGRLITIEWSIEDITVIKRIALGTDQNSDIIGNAGISIEVINNGNDKADVGIRFLLDTALGNKIDAPYVVVDESITPTSLETEYIGEDVPSQLRNVDSLSNPRMVSYLMTKGWQGGMEPNKIIVGHWENIANTRYDYQIDPYCDFTSLVNPQKTADAAMAVYWEKEGLEVGKNFKGEALYGVGNFSGENSDKNVGINITTERVELTDDGTAYKNNGEIEVTVEIDNTLDNSTDLMETVLTIDFDDEEFEEISSKTITYSKIGKEIKTVTFRVKALPQDEITAGEIYASLSATNTSSQTTEMMSERSIILPSVKGKLAEIQMNEVNPKIVWTGGEKAVTITGDMSEFETLKANQGWDLRLKHTTSDHSVLIAKSDVSFLDKELKNIAFKTSEELEVGFYELVFEFTDPLLISSFGKKITANAKLQVSANEKYRLKSYGIISLVRTTINNTTDYDFYSFANEGQYLQFYDGELEKTGMLNGTKIKHDFGEDIDAIGQHEILVTVKGNLIEMERDVNGNKEKYWQADVADGDVIINNILSYQGDEPLEIYRDNELYLIEGDGLIKVVNSINIWRNEWDIRTQKGIVYSLDPDRISGYVQGGANTVELGLGGAGQMIQSLGGFLIDITYGVLSSEWWDGGDGRVTYGIGFGGRVSIPIVDEKNTKKPSSTTSPSSTTAPSSSTTSTTSTTGTTTTSVSKKNKLQRKSTGLTDGQISAAINEVRFGEKARLEDKKVVVDDTGYIGIDTQVSFGVPKDALGALIGNKAGFAVNMTINTIENIYEFNLGINVKIIQCEAIIGFKEVNVKNKDKVVPDRLEFYIREGLSIPLGPPATPLYITGLGGGLSGLADTIGGAFTKLPPITITAFMRLQAIGLLTGDFTAKLNLEGVSITGDFYFNKFKDMLQIDAGLSARWVNPWSINLYGNADILDGIIKGGITVTIADDYFYGYIYAGIYIPDSVPLVGGKQLAGVEAAASHEFIGANVKIIGIRFGVIYYWGEDVKFSQDVDLSPPAVNTAAIDAVYEEENAEAGITSYYGTNMRTLNSTTRKKNADGEFELLSDSYTDVVVTIEGAEGQDSLLLEIPFNGSTDPQSDELMLVNPDGKEIAMVDDDNHGGGNFLVQHRDGARYIYISVTDDENIKSGDWTFKYKTDGIETEEVTVSAVDDISEITETTAVYSGGYQFDAEWRVTGDYANATSVDVYLTKDKNTLENIKTDNNTSATLGDNVLHLDNAEDIKKGKATVTIPESYESGEYYVVTMLSTLQGATCAITANTFKFENPKLPKPVKSIKLSHAGNGDIKVDIEDADNADYTDYLVELEAKDGTPLTNNFNQYSVDDDNILIGKDANLKVGSEYRVVVRTLREESITPAAGSTDAPVTNYFYGDELVASDYITARKVEKPVLESVATDIDTTKEFISDRDVTVEYTFDRPVWVELDVRGQKIWSGDDSYRKVWSFDIEDLEDGDYIVDFTAYTEEGDYVTGADFQDVADAQLGFTVDSANPVLSLAQRHAESLAQNENGEAITATFGANVVIAADDGSYTIEGMTETDAVLTIDGLTDGLSVDNGGAFTYSGVLAEGVDSIEHTLKAVDKANNESELVVTVVNAANTAFERIILLADGKEIEKDENGVMQLSITNAQSIKLTVLGETADGRRVELSDDMIEYSILYAKNNVSLTDGTLDAVLPGETAVKVKLLNTTIETEDGRTVRAGLEDYVVVTIRDNSKEDLRKAIENANTALEEGKNKKTSAKNTLKEAIEAAQAVYDDEDATATEISEAVTALNNAIEAFKKSSTASGGGSSGGGNSTYTIKVEETENGTVTLSHDKAKEGTSVTVTATPDEGYEVYDMLINGVSVGNESVYTITSVTADTTVKVLFTKIGEKPKWNPFEDVTAYDWFHDAVKKAYEDGLMVGISSTMFGPDTNVTRGMFVTVLHRIEGEPSAGDCVFTDVADGSYYERAIAWANENEIVAGISHTEYAPDASITREQMAAILYRYSNYKGYDTSIGEDTNILSFTDAEEISEYAIPAMQWAIGAGIISGKGNGILDPRGNATRAETASVLTRMLDN